MRPSPSPSNPPSSATSGLSVHVSAVKFQDVNNCSIPSIIPSPSVSTLFGSEVHPVKLTWSEVMKEPNENSTVFPGHCCRANAEPTVVTNHCGDDRFWSVSLYSGAIALYSSQLAIPSSSASSHRSAGSKGFRVHASSRTFHRANQTSQPSGIPSESESAFNGSEDPTSVRD